MSDGTICPCDTFLHPTIPLNDAGLSHLSYRAGDFVAFREALLRSLPGEQELLSWRPSARGDLAVQMVEWWAFLCDILTFYNERITNESYLRTALLDADVRRLIRLLGYRPRPGIGAHGTLAAVTARDAPLSLPVGFPIGSKPGPGKQPQVFELDSDVTFSPPSSLPVEPLPDRHLIVNGGVLLQGTVTTVAVGDRVVVLPNGWNASQSNFAVAAVSALQPELDPQGRTNTRVMLGNVSVNGDISAATIDGYSLLRSSTSGRLWTYLADSVIRYPLIIYDRVGGTATSVLGIGGTISTFIWDILADLDALYRTINVGDPILFQMPGGTDASYLASVDTYTEVVWLANPKSGADPTVPQDDPKVPAVPIPHTRIGISSAPGSIDLTTLNDTTKRTQLLLHFGWQPVGQAIPTAVSGPTTAVTPLQAIPPAVLPSLSTTPLLLEDAAGAGLAASGATSGSPPTLSLSNLPQPVPALTPPFQLLLDLLPVSRGKTVPQEILGSGNAAIPGQEFVLAKSPLTYLQSGASTSGEGYASTLHIWVNGIEWHEVSTFYQQAPDARVFVTREDDDGKTHVLFGDGINGSRLPTGANNVVARYRFGSGSEAPAAGSLTVIQQSWPNLRSLLNPVAVGGGADPEAAAHIRRLAPQSVLTFGRAVSGGDYEAIAGHAPGVTRASAVWSWNAESQHGGVTVYVGDDAAAVESAQTALAGADDPNRPLVVQAAQGIPLFMSLTLLVDPDYHPDAVAAAATSALLDPDTGLFSPESMRIGRPLYRSQIEAACLVPGAVAVQRLFAWAEIFWSFWWLDFRIDPGEGGYFTLTSDYLSIATEVAHG